MTKAYPITPKRNEILKALEQHQVVILTGQTATGKTTEFPIYLLEAGFGEKGIITCTEPRRPAAMRPAKHVAEKLNVELGEEVGYHIRFDRTATSSTKLQYVTEGILMQEAISDPLLSKHSCIIVDEIHERSIWTDLLLAYIKSVLPKRKDLRLVLSSATADIPELRKYFPNAHRIDIPSRTWPITIEYRENVENWKEQAVSEAVRIISSNLEGDMLIFAPGIREIRAILGLFEALKLPDVDVLPLYGGIDADVAAEVFGDSPRRKIIVATNIAETSLTLKCSWVIDSGLARISGYNAEGNYPTLYTSKISRASCDQRAGRAGRTEAGTCIRLYAEEDYLARTPFNTPEIMRSDLSGLVLNLKARGITDIRSLDLLTSPPEDLVRAAEQKLKKLGALDGADRITDTGKMMSQIRLDPELAAFVLESWLEGHSINRAAKIAAFISVRNAAIRTRTPEEEELQRERQEEFRSRDCDFITFLNIMDAWKKAPDQVRWCEEYDFHQNFLEGISEMSEQIVSSLWRLGSKRPKHESKDERGLHKSIATLLRKNLLTYHQHGKYTTEDGIGGIKISKRSVLAKQGTEYLVTSGIVDVEGLLLASHVSIVKPDWLEEWGMASARGKDSSAEKSGIQESGDSVVPSHDAPQSKFSTIRSRGLLTVEMKHVKKYLAVDINLERSTSRELRLVRNASVVMEETALAIENFRFTSETEHALKNLGIRTFSELPRSEERLRGLGLQEANVKEVSRALRTLGCLAYDIPDTKEAALDDASKKRDYGPGRLFEEFLLKPVYELGISRNIAAKFIAAGFATIGDVTRRSEAQLLELRFIGQEAVDEVKERLLRFGFALSEDSAFGTHRELDWVVGEKVVQNVSGRELTELELRDILGKQYDSLNAYREANNPEDRIRLRNEIALANKGLCHKWANLYGLWWQKIEDSAIDHDDLFQEGFIGLLRAVTSYDYHLGYRFSTYATWWIKQIMQRLFCEWKGMPVHVAESIVKMRAAVRELEQKEIKVTPEAIAHTMNISVYMVGNLMEAEKFWYGTVSLDAPIRADSDGEEITLGSTIIDTGPAPVELYEKKELQEKTARMLDRAPLLAIERQMLELYYGMDGKGARTLEEVGEIFGVTRERVRQRLEQGRIKLRTTENWEMVRGLTSNLEKPYDNAPPEAIARWDFACKTFEGIRNAIHGQHAATEEILEKVAAAFEIAASDIPLPKKVDSPDDVIGQQLQSHEQYVVAGDARKVSAALLWTETALFPDEIENLLNVKNIVLSIRSFNKQLERRGVTIRMQDRIVLPFSQAEADAQNPQKVWKQEQQRAEKFLESFSQRHGLSLEELRASDRTSDVVSIRQQAAVLLAANFNLRLPDIANLLRRDLGSIAHLYRKAPKAMKKAAKLNFTRKEDANEN